MSSDMNIGTPHTKPHLLSLPVEIRRNIYFYALLNSKLYVASPRQWRNKVASFWDAFYRPQWPHWGQDAMSRLFRVNRQVHSEVEELFYGSGNFIFEWPESSCACCVPLLLARRSSKARELMSSIYICLIHKTSQPEARYQEWFRETQFLYQTLLMKLPALGSVAISVEFIGTEVDSIRKAELATSILKLASIFHNVQKLELYHGDATNPFKQRAQIVDGVVDRVKRQDWEDPEQLDPEYCCCSEERKAHLRL